MNFMCSKCNKIFENYNECVSHEKKCFKLINNKCYLKYIKLDSDYNDNEIHVYEHPNAIQVSDNYYNCCPNHRYYDEEIEIKEFDTVFIDDNDGCYCIITKDANEEHERESIKKLFDYKKQKMTDYYNELQNLINFLGKSYKTYRKII